VPHVELPPIFSRHWTEYVLAIFTMVIAALSLWVAVDSEFTNRELVAEASWPFLQIYYSDLDSEGHPDITLNIANAGVGPAKIETLEVFWKGKPYPDSPSLLWDCCRIRKNPQAAQPNKSVFLNGGLVTSLSAGSVLRPDKVISIVRYPLAADNARNWYALKAAGEDFRYRICYCSVFDQCWLSDGRNLNPTRTSFCPEPKVSYSE
jgi:hypothetical protein